MNVLQHLFNRKQKHNKRGVQSIILSDLITDFFGSNFGQICNMSSHNFRCFNPFLYDLFHINFFIFSPKIKKIKKNLKQNLAQKIDTVLFPCQQVSSARLKLMNALPTRVATKARAQTT